MPTARMGVRVWRAWKRLDKRGGFQHLCGTRQGVVVVVAMVVSVAACFGLAWQAGHLDLGTILRIVEQALNALQGAM